MSNTFIHIISTLSIVFFVLSPVYGENSAERPNIVLILADDLGIGCTGAYGARKDLIQTPAIDQLASDGRKFFNAYTPSSVCSPTRYALLTGEYQWRHGKRYGVEGAKSKLCIPVDRPTLASRLKGLGYNTAAIGKWHLGYQNSQVDYTKPLSPGPLDLGFDYHWGIPNNNGDVTGVWVENDKVYGLVDQMEDLPKNQHHPAMNWLGREMIGIPAPYREDTSVIHTLNTKINDWIGKQTKETPFFLYYPTPAIHVPLSPGPKYQGVSKAGPYGDFIMELDGSVSNLMHALEKHGFTKNTIVIFTSDNGSHPSTGEAAVEAGLKMNGDYRGTKLTVWEGGFRVPMIVKWPGKIKAGSVSNELVNVVDIYATLMGLLNQQMKEPQIEAGDSYDFSEALFSNPHTPIRDHMIYTSFEGIVSIQSAGWKYIEGEMSDPNPKWMNHRMEEAVEQLYHIEKDPYEMANIIDKQLKLKDQLKVLLHEIRIIGYSRSRNN